MNKNILTIAIAALLLPLSAVSFAQGNSLNQPFSDKVSYKCQSDKNIEVTYNFNEEGLPTKASANISGEIRELPINLKHSDDVSTVFGEEDHYMISSGYMDNENYQKSSILVFSPSSEILFKNCNANNDAIDKQSQEMNQNASTSKTVKEESVHYACQNNREIDVKYGFNEQGLPTQAKVKLDGKNHTIPINLRLSSASGQVFGGENQYMLGTGPLDVTNFKKSNMMLTAPNNEILYKNCSVK